MNDKKPSTDIAKAEKTSGEAVADIDVDDAKKKEIGGFEDRPEPTRFGDWEVNGRCSDF